MKEKWIQWLFCRIPVFLIMAVFLGVLFVHFGRDKDVNGQENSRKALQAEQGQGRGSGYKREEEERFVEFTREMFRQEAGADMLTLNYTLAQPEKYGIEGENSLGSYTEESMEQGVKYAREKEQELKKINRDFLSKDSRFLYDIIMEELKTCQEQEKFLYFSECLRPKSGITAQLPMLLTEYHFYREDSIEEYFGLLNDIPRYFGEILEFQKLKFNHGLFMDDEWAGEVIKQCRDFADSKDKNVLIAAFNKKLKDIYKGKGAFSLTKKQVKEYKRIHRDIVNKQVLPAFRELGEGIEALTEKRKNPQNKSDADSRGEDVRGQDSGKEAAGGELPDDEKQQRLWENSIGNPQGLALYENGRSYYEFMVRNATGSSKTVEELDLMLKEAIKKETDKMREAFLDEETLKLYDKSEMPKGLPQELLLDLKNKMAPSFTPLSQVAAENNCGLNEENLYTLKYVDKSMEDVLSPAFYLTPALDNFQENTIYINREKMKKGESLYATLGHEAYPGHMYQMVYFQLKQENPLRYIFNFPGYSEGWGTYAECYAYDMAGLEGKMAQVEKSGLIINMCIFGRLDIGVNYYGWNEGDMEAYLSGLGIAKNMDIKALYQLMVEEPCMYLKYIAGYLEIMELKKKAEIKLGNRYSEKWFHDFFLSTGPAPFWMIGERIKEYVPGQ